MAEVENVDANPRWIMPRPGIVKINVHGCFFVNTLPNGHARGVQTYVEKMEHFVLECNHVDSFWEWRNSSLEGVHPDHAEIVQQLNQRNADRNFHMEVRLCETNANALAIYLAHHGAEHYKQIVIMAQPFGQVFELWNRDMGLDSVDPQFMAVHEEDVVPAVVDDGEQAVPEVDDGAQMLAGGKWWK
ncbi:hypothetical protein ACET3Z_032451 [Daucus carota]